VLNLIEQQFGLPTLSLRQRPAAAFDEAFQFEGAPRHPPVFSVAEVPATPVASPEQNRFVLAMYVAALGLVAAISLSQFVWRRA